MTQTITYIFHFKFINKEAYQKLLLTFLFFTFSNGISATKYEIKVWCYQVDKFPKLSTTHLDFPGSLGIPCFPCFLIEGVVVREVGAKQLVTAICEEYTACTFVGAEMAETRHKELDLREMKWNDVILIKATTTQVLNPKILTKNMIWEELREIMWF